MTKITFINHETGRLDKVITDYLRTSSTPLSRTKIQELIIQKLVYVNNQPVNNNYSSQIGDKIVIKFPEATPSTLTPLSQSLEILYEDDYLMVINKPNNLVVHPAPGHDNDTLVNILLAHNAVWSTISGETRPGIVHRIDRQTTGLLIIAKNDQIHEQLQLQIQTKLLHRRYLALVHGVINENRAKIDAPIGRDPKNRKKMAVTAKNSKKAVTNIVVIERFNDYTYIECELETGRTHQIRVHLKYINHPVLGDPLYGNTIDQSEPFGQYLHAYQLTFTHPISKEVMTITSELPVEFIEKLNELKQKG